MGLGRVHRRAALALCRAAGLHEVASTRAELDELRAEHRALRDAYTAHIELVKAIARQTNTNTLLLKRWLEGSPTLQLIERAAGQGRKVVVPPTGDLRTGGLVIASK